MEKYIIKSNNPDIISDSVRYRTEEGEISLVSPCTVTFDTYEIFCTEGDLFEGIKRFRTMEEAEVEITELLSGRYKSFRHLEIKEHSSGEGELGKMIFDNGFGIEVGRFKVFNSYFDDWIAVVLKVVGTENVRVKTQSISVYELSDLTPPKISEIMRRIQKLKKPNVFRLRLHSEKGSDPVEGFVVEEFSDSYSVIPEYSKNSKFSVKIPELWKKEYCEVIE